MNKGEGKGGGEARPRRELGGQGGRKGGRVEGREGRAMGGLARPPLTGGSSPSQNPETKGDGESDDGATGNRRQRFKLRGRRRGGEQGRGEGGGGSSKLWSM